MLLAINTATPFLSLALLEDGHVLAEAGADVGGAHSEAIFPLLESLFAWAARTPADLRAVGVAVGPGGFTGLRTGIALARAVAQARGLPAYGVDTLQALAAQLPGAGLVAPMLDARRGLVFAGLFRLGAGSPEPVAEGALRPIEAWLDRLRDEPGPIACVGEGALRHREALAAESPRLWLPPESAMRAGAVAVGLLAGARFGAGLPTETADLAPRYLREPQAVVNWEAAQRALEGG